MSTILYVYAVQIRTLASVFGSADRSILDLVKKKTPDKYRIRVWSDSAFGYKEDGCPTIDEAVDEIVNGSITRPAYGSQYGLALELICGVLGVELPNEEFAGLHTSLYEILMHAGLDGIAARMLCVPRYPIPIPHIEDLPLVSCLTAKEAAIDNEASAFKNDNSGALSEQKRMSEMFKSWLDHAANTKSDLVTFYY